MELAERRKQERRQEQEDNVAEIANLLRGDLLSENPQQAASALGPHRMIPHRWKGMSREQLEGIRLAQRQQIQEKLVPGPSPPRPPSSLLLSNRVFGGAMKEYKVKTACTLRTERELHDTGAWLSLPGTRAWDRYIISDWVALRAGIADS